MGSFFKCKAVGYNVQIYTLRIENADKDNHFVKFCPYAVPNANQSVFDVICPSGLVTIRCSAYLSLKNSEILVTSSLLPMELIGLSPEMPLELFFIQYLFFPTKTKLKTNLHMYILLWIRSHSPVELSTSQQ